MLCGKDIYVYMLMGVLLMMNMWLQVLEKGTRLGRGAASLVVKVSPLILLAAFWFSNPSNPNIVVSSL